jgi:lipopolysaccharide transport system permease protein
MKTDPSAKMNFAAEDVGMDSRPLAAGHSLVPEHGPGTATALPRKAAVVIQPSRSWVPLNLNDIWAYRELLYFLVWRDVKVRYKQTALGAAWAILQPLFMMLIFTLFFGRVAASQTGSVPYPLFALAGLVPWTFFSTAISMSGNSLVANSNLVTKVYFPRLIMPMAAVLAGLVDFALSWGLLIVLMLYYGIKPNSAIAMLPVLILITVLFSIGMGTWLSAINVKYRDVRFVLPFLIQLWLFVSSVILPSSAVGPRWRWLLLLNPMSAIIEGYRAALLGLPFHWIALTIAAVMTLMVTAYAAYEFKRMEKRFADTV